MTANNRPSLDVLVPLVMIEDNIMNDSNEIYLVNHKKV